MTGVLQPELAAKAARGVTWSVGGNFGLRIFNVATNIAMAHLIAPEQFGVFAVALTVWVIVGTVAEFGLGSDLIRADRPLEREPTTLVLALGLSCGIGALTAATAGQIAVAFGSADSVDVIRLMAVSTAISGLAVVPFARLQRDLRQKAMVTVNLIAAVTSAVVMLSFATWGLGPSALAWGQIAGQCVGVVCACVATGYRMRLGFDPTVAAASVRFCLPLASANLVSWLLLTLDNLVIARVLGPTQLGLYVLAFNVSSWPMSAIGQALRVVALPVFSQIHDHAQRAGVLVRTTTPVVAITAPIAMGLATMATPVVELLYGERWDGAAAALGGLAVFGGMRVVLDVFATYLIAVGKPASVLVIQSVWVAAMLPAVVIGAHNAGLAGAGWAHVAVGVLVAAPMYGVFLRRAGVDVRALGLSVARPLMWLVPSAITCTWIGRRDADPVLLLALGGVAGLVLYVAPIGPTLLRSVRRLRMAPAPQDG